MPGLFDPQMLLTALLQTERTTANVHTSNNDQRRFFQDSDMRDPLLEVYENQYLLNQDLRSMDWSNRFTLGGFTVTYCIPNGLGSDRKKDDYEVAFDFLQKKAEDFCLSKKTLK